MEVMGFTERMPDSEELESTLAFGVYAKGVSGLSDITVSLKQYK